MSGRYAIALVDLDEVLDELQSNATCVEDHTYVNKLRESLEKSKAWRTSSENKGKEKMDPTLRRFCRTYASQVKQQFLTESKEARERKERLSARLVEMYKIIETQMTTLSTKEKFSTHLAQIAICNSRGGPHQSCCICKVPTWTVEQCSHDGCKKMFCKEHAEQGQWICRNKCPAHSCFDCALAGVSETNVVDVCPGCCHGWCEKHFPDPISAEDHRRFCKQCLECM